MSAGDSAGTVGTIGKSRAPEPDSARYAREEQLIGPPLLEGGALTVAREEQLNLGEPCVSPQTSCPSPPEPPGVPPKSPRGGNIHRDRFKCDIQIPGLVPKSLRAGVEGLLRDRKSFCKLLNIKHKQLHRFVPFEPNEAQERLWDLMDRTNRVIVIKARQVGISTAVRAWQFHRAYTSKNPETYAVQSFHDRSAKNLRRMDRRWLRGLPDLLHRTLDVDSAEETVFADTLAGFSSFTTGGRGGTRSFEFTGAHLSEFAFYSDPDEVLAQSVSTVGDGPLVIESTANVPGDAFHRLIENAPENGWSVFTYWWWQHGPYRDENLPDDFCVTASEAELADRYGLDDAQLYWRRKLVSTLGLNSFRREYPGCLDDAFLSRESTYFSAEDLDSIEVVWFETPQREFAAPEPNRGYVMGVDVSGGVGRDYSALVVVALGTLQPAYIERSNKLAPHEWAARVATVAQRYNDALVLCESNNHGHVVLRELHLLRYRRLWRKPNGKHWVTTVRSKLDAYECLREHIRAGILFALDQSTIQELRGLEVRKVTPEAPAGLHDDLAMALALAYRCVRSAPRSQRRDSSRGHMDDFIRQRRVLRIREQALPWRRAE